eukprot:scaffold87511_cov17-Tisochrysis_lutea.AAC.2
MYWQRCWEETTVQPSLTQSLGGWWTNGVSNLRLQLKGCDAEVVCCQLTVLPVQLVARPLPLS